ncbi:MAG: hypothetical protein ACRDBO_16480 [Lachnospiraceae bacterium]
MENVFLFYIDFNDEGYFFHDIGALTEIRIRKDGRYMFGASGISGNYKDQFALDEWVNSDGSKYSRYYSSNGYFNTVPLPRWGVFFDEKGYVVSFEDGIAG